MQSLDGNILYCLLPEYVFAQFPGLGFGVGGMDGAERGPGKSRPAAASGAETLVKHDTSIQNFLHIE